MVQSRNDLEGLPTEAGSNAATGFEKRPTIELVELMNAGDSTVPDAVAAAATSIADAVDAISAQLRDGVGHGGVAGVHQLDQLDGRALLEFRRRVAPGLGRQTVEVAS